MWRCTEILITAFNICIVFLDVNSVKLKIQVVSESPLLRLLWCLDYLMQKQCLSFVHQLWLIQQQTNGHIFVVCSVLNQLNQEVVLPANHVVHWDLLFGCLNKARFQQVERKHFSCNQVALLLSTYVDLPCFSTRRRVAFIEQSVFDVQLSLMPSICAFPCGMSSPSGDVLDRMSCKFCENCSVWIPSRVFLLP